jgi:hypothetical protein
LHSIKWSDGKKKKGWKPFFPQNNLILDPEGNEENRYLVPDSNKTKLNDAKKHNKAHKNTLKEILQVITENFMNMLLDMVNLNVKEELKKFQDTKNKEYEKTPKK